VEGLASGVARLQLTGEGQTKGSSTRNSNSNGNSNGSSGTESLTNQAPTSEWRQEGQMLSEFSKLGKVCMWTLAAWHLTDLGMTAQRETACSLRTCSPH